MIEPVVGSAWPPQPERSPACCSQSKFVDQAVAAVVGAEAHADAIGGPGALEAVVAEVAGDGAF